MPIAGTGTGPFTVTGTETILSIFNFVVAANAANATKNANNTQFFFNCVVNFGDGTTVTNVNPTELQVEFNGASFAVLPNAAFQMGTPNPPRAGGYLRINAGGNSLNLRGTFQLFASRYFTAAAEPSTTNTGNNVLFDECSLNMVNGYGNSNGAFNPTITYRNCQLAGASSVALKLAGQMTVIAPKVYNSTFAFQPLPAAGAATTYTVSDAVIVGCTNDVVPNSVIPVTTNFVGVFDGTGAPRTGLILASPSNASITRLQWRYNLTAFLGQLPLSGATVRILSTVTNPPSTIFSGTTNASGAITQQTLTRIEYLGQAAGFSRWPYAVDVRAYDKTSAQLTYNAENHAQQVTASTAITTSLTQVQAAALTGITLTPTTTPTTVQSVTNGNFATDTNWTKGSGVTISGGVANVTNASTILTQNIDVVPGLTYTFSMDYNKTAGIALRFSNSLVDSTNLIHTTGTLANGTGTITFTFTAVRSGLVIAASGAVFSGTIDNVSCTTTYNAVSPNNGVLAISTSKTVADIWSFWRNYISTLANFDSADNWTYDGSILSAGAWTTSITGGTVSVGTLTSPTISVVSPAIVSANLIGPVTNSGTISGDITGAVINSGTINGANITGNVSQATPTNLTGVTITGNYTFNTNTPVAISFTNTTITGTVSNSGTGLVSIDLFSGSSVGTVGANVAVQVPVYVTAPNIINGSRVQLYDVTNGVELFNGILSAPLNYEHAYTGDITVRMRVTYQSGLTAKLPVLATGLLTASGLQFLDAQVNDTVYIGYGIDGSAVTGFSADYVNTEVNLNAATNFTAASLYAWWVFNTTTAQGIDNFFLGLVAEDAGNLQIDTSVVNLYLDNTTSTFIYQLDTIRLYRTDGAYPARTVTSGGGGIDVNWKNVVYVVQAAPALTLPQFLALQNP